VVAVAVAVAAAEEAVRAAVLPKVSLK